MTAGRDAADDRRWDAATSCAAGPNSAGGRHLRTTPSRPPLRPSHPYPLTRSAAAAEPPGGAPRCFSQAGGPARCRAARAAGACRCVLVPGVLHARGCAWPHGPRPPRRRAAARLTAAASRGSCRGRVEIEIEVEVEV